MTQAEAIQMVETEYQRRRAQRERERDARVDEVRKADPEISRLQSRLPMLFSAGVKKILAHDEDGNATVDRLKDEVMDIQARIASRIAKKGFPPDYLDMRYDCALCKDTGYVGESGQRRCNCFAQRIMQLQFDYAHALVKHSFEAFDAAIYPSDAQRAQAESAMALCQAYADAYPGNAHINLVLLGTSGLGKTFLLDSVAHRIMARGHVALTMTGFRMLEAMRAYHFGETQPGAAFDRMLNCPILFIDDLGTEPMMRNITIEYLFTLLNERGAARRHTVIATNLVPAQLNERYGERVVSRLLDQRVCQAIWLTGEDLRLGKR